MVLIKHVHLTIRIGSGNPLQCSRLENPRDGGAWWATVHGVAKRWTQLSDFTFTFPLHAFEKEMTTHSSVLAWRIPGRRSLVGCRLWGRSRTDGTWQQQQQQHTHWLTSDVALQSSSTPFPYVHTHNVSTAISSFRFLKSGVS